LALPPEGTYSRYLIRLNGSKKFFEGQSADARGIHHWGGLDTFDPYVLHCSAVRR
jgi:hypothetical protein